MKITLISGGKNTVLAEGSDKVFITSFSSELLVDTQQFIRAAYARPVARGNKTEHLAFQVIRQHANERASQSYFVSHALTMSRAGSLRIDAEDGGSSQTFTLLNSVVQTVTAQRYGISTEFNYTVVAGEMTTSAVTGSEDES